MYLLAFGNLSMPINVESGDSSSRDSSNHGAGIFMRRSACIHTLLLLVSFGSSSGETSNLFAQAAPSGSSSSPGGVTHAAANQAATSRLDPLDQWPGWRGPLQTGVSPHGTPPLTWDENKHVRWKVELPGKGLSTPVIWGDHIFLTAAESYGERVKPRFPPAPGAHDNLDPSYAMKFHVIALNRKDGSTLWTTTVNDLQPHDSAHRSASWASNSPVTDGEHVFAFFGSNGLYSLDFDGHVVWKVDLGDMSVKHGHGEGASPAIFGDTLVINWDHEGDSFVAAFDKRDGHQRWKVKRDEPTSWSSPIIVKVEGKPQVIIAATHRVRGYDLDTGNLIWECGGLSGNVVASPVYADGRVVVGNSYDGRALFSIRVEGARGDLTGSDFVEWKIERYTPYVPSLLLYDGHLLSLSHYQGILVSLDARSGEPRFGLKRLYGVQNIYASPVGAAGRVYIVSLNGVTAVVTRDGDYRQLATNELDDVLAASPAIAGDAIYLRGERFLYCIAQDN